MERKPSTTRGAPQCACEERSSYAQRSGLMEQDQKIQGITQKLHRFFQDRGALSIEPDVLQPAELLLDLYGEDIRARAYLAPDSLRGEQMLRPDYTIPVVQIHMEGRANPARYTYSGKVFRKQEQNADLASEYIQVGYERLGITTLLRLMLKYLWQFLMHFQALRQKLKPGT